MRSLLVCLFSLVVFSFAVSSAAAQSQAASNDSLTSSLVKLLGPSAGLSSVCADDSCVTLIDPSMLGPEQRAQLAENHLDTSRSLLILSGREFLDPFGPTCYAMRTYRVAQDEPTSDATHLAGYSTCQWARRFTVKNTSPPLELPTR